MTERDELTKTYTCPQCGEIIKHSTTADLFEVAIDHLPKCPGQKGAPIIKRITDIVPEDVLKGNLVAIDDILGREVLIKDITWRESTFKEDTDYLSLTLDIDGEEKVLNTGAVRVIQAFKAVAPEQLPLYARFEKIQLPNGRRVYTVG